MILVQFSTLTLINLLTEKKQIELVPFCRTEKIASAAELIFSNAKLATFLLNGKFSDMALVLAT